MVVIWNCSNIWYSYVSPRWGLCLAAVLLFFRKSWPFKFQRQFFWTCFVIQTPKITFYPRVIVSNNSVSSFRAPRYFQPERQIQMGCLEGRWRYMPISLSPQKHISAKLYNFVISANSHQCLQIQIMVNSGKSKEEAMADYITKVKQLLEEASASTS